MKDLTKNKYFYLATGYLGLLLIGLAALRVIVILQDTPIYVMTLLGFVGLVNYFKFADDKIGVTTRDMIIFRAGLIVILIISAIILYR